MPFIDSSARAKSSSKERQIFAHLIEHHYYYRHDKNEDEMIIIDNPANDPDHTYYKDIYYRMDVGETHADFCAIKRRAERSIWGIRGIVTRDGTVVFGRTGAHNSFGNMFDKFRLFDFFDLQNIHNSSREMRVTGNGDAIKYGQPRLPTYAELMQTLSFLVENLLLGFSDAEDIVLICSVKIVGQDGTPLFLSQKMTCREWKRYFEVNADSIQKLKLMSPPFQST